ncbi:hypothetical protein AS203_04255 [Hoylesella enoeca]|uniref:Uncharacterized protein n=1 Tax=Hoylesella enoeca TaxID=76123 RepID=A0A0S2KJH5_9BACT|nr:hypothetical protein AS203_04255 [Hoylesella enoeca]
MADEKAFFVGQFTVFRKPRGSYFVMIKQLFSHSFFALSTYFTIFAPPNRNDSTIYMDDYHAENKNV